MKTQISSNTGNLTDDEKITGIARNFKSIMELLGLNLMDDSLADTPNRVAKMYVQEIFSGLNPKNKPVITLFKNKYQYNEMLIVKDITLHSQCEHHFVPIVGKAHVAYFSSGTIIGLSKINRIVQYYSNRPQVQERLTIEIANALKEALGTEDVAVVIEAIHYCVAYRGIKDTNSLTTTSNYSGKFKTVDTKANFFTLLNIAASVKCACK